MYTFRSKFSMDMNARSRSRSIIGWRAIYSCVFWLYVFHIVGETLKVPHSPGWTSSPNSGTCVRLSNDQKPWDEARISCQKDGGDLVKILDSKMNTFITGLLSPSVGLVYIGLRKIEKKFQWLDEESEATYMYLSTDASGETGNACGKIDDSAKRQWLFGNCTSNHNYFCEKGPDLCPNEWLPSAYSGTCVKLFKNLTTMRNARKTCQDYGGDLVMIGNTDMNIFIYDQFSRNDTTFYFIGLNRLNDDDRLQWLDHRDEVRFTRWGRNQSNSFGNCVTVNNEAENVTMAWFDSFCDEENGFICERFSDCENEKYGMLCPVQCNSTGCAGSNTTITCNVRNGTCYDGCKMGYHGPKCDKNSAVFCSTHCASPKTCNILTGVCDGGCEKGYTGLKCDIAITSNQVICSTHCASPKTCNILTGVCDGGCEKGYTGLKCDIAITSNQVICSAHCAGPSKACNTLTGACNDGCEEGYAGLKCNFVEATYSAAVQVFAYSIFVSAVFAPCILAFGLFALLKKRRDSPEEDNGRESGDTMIIETLKP